MEKQKTFKIILYTLLFFVVLQTDLFAQEELSMEDNPISLEALEYLQDAIHIMEQCSVNKGMIDWDHLKQQVFITAEHAQTIPETYQAIKLALTLLQENHSYFLTPEQVKYLENNNHQANQLHIEPKAAIINDNIGYLLIPSLMSLSETTLKEYASHVQALIQHLDQCRLDRWIIDLRGNQGGHMWPMVLGLGPLLGSEIFGYFSDDSSENYAWIYDGLSVRIDDYLCLSLDAPGYFLYQSQPRIAVLVDKDTGSSGESTAIAFLGRENTKSFGQKTAGYTTANELYRLSDEAVIMLATTYNADRLGRVYKDGIIPDVIIPDAGDPVLHAAVNWLEE